MESINLKNYKSEGITPNESSLNNYITPGAYICKIHEANIEQVENGIKLRLNVDIATGEFKGFFSDSALRRSKWPFSAQFTRYIVKDGVIQNSYLDLVKHLEASNPTFMYDEENLTAAQFENLYCGFTFGEEEFLDKFGNKRKIVRVKFSAPVQKIKEGKVKPPKPNLLEEEPPAPEDDTVFKESDLPF